MESAETRISKWKDPLIIAFVLASAKVFLFLLAGNQYGYFRDELYFLACADHLALGYPDHAPLSVFLTDFSRRIFGDSLYAIRFFPMLSGVLKIALTGFLVREFGGKHFAMLLACLSVLVGPIYLATDNLLSMNTYEPIFWMGCVLGYLWAVKRKNQLYWLLFGAFAGLGLMNKHSIVFFGFALVVGLTFTADRKVLANKHFWLGGMIAFLIFLPNLIWQYQNDWATLELLQNVQKTGKNVVLAPHEFFFEQIFILNPLTAPVWLAGLWFLLFDKTGKRFRTLGIAYLVTLALMILLKAKNYYLAPVYPVLFAAGGVFWENLSERFGRARALKYVYPVILVLGGIMFTPLAMPVLPIDTYLKYQATIGIKPPKTEVGHEGLLPQHFGDMFGWEEMVAKTAEVYHSLSAEEKARAVIFGSNYGEAGAIDHFGPKYDLPKAVSTHQSYYLWGYGQADGSLLILLGSDREDAEKNCRAVEEKALVEHPLAMAEERFNILLCRGLKDPLPELWKKIKHWN
jgi:hypothetical protein